MKVTVSAQGPGMKTRLQLMMGGASKSHGKELQVEEGVETWGSFHREPSMVPLTLAVRLKYNCL